MADPRRAPRLEHRGPAPGEVAALANGDPLSAEGFRGTERTAWRGRALAIVRPTGPGEIRVRVEALGLEPTETSITAR